ncbi:MAG: mechanosensitive ion channel family protein [Cyclobacteriaceae bacterium]|nr:mechanosensitive ion channel family protein [Cyclobacteriaceae bacterium]UYN87949.1 MAG: mechanosensitive ion channel family protein [Cyclobacteriaceae bacterium]
MEPFHLKIIETVLVLVGLVILSFLIKGAIQKIGNRYHLQKDRTVFTLKVITIGLYLAAAVTLLFIWGVDQNELVLFLSSFIAILGIALFAQWSMLSNVTASILLFVSHPAKVGDSISILDKDYPLTGKIKDIGAFFTIIETETNEVVTIPNSLLFQKMIKVISL